MSPSDSDDIIVEEIGEGYGPKISGEKSSRPSGREKVFRVFWTDSEDEAYYQLASYVHNGFAKLGRLVVESIEVEEESPGSDLWTGTVRYREKTPDKKKLLKDFPDYSFSTRGGRAKVTHSLETLYAGAAPEPVYVVSSVGNDKASDNSPILRQRIKKVNGKIQYNHDVKPPNFKRGIGFDNGVFQGTEKVVPAWTSTVGLTVPYDRVSPQYMRLLRAMTGAVNSRPFDTMRPGECLFMGCDGNSRVKDDSDEDEDDIPDDELTLEQLRSKYLVWDLKFEFCGSPNMVKQFVDKIGPFNKRGWDYVWVLREDREANDDDESAESPSDTTESPETEPGTTPQEPLKFSTKNMTIPVPKAVYVERVYSYADFATMGVF